MIGKIIGYLIGSSWECIRDAIRVVVDKGRAAMGFRRKSEWDDDDEPPFDAQGRPYEGAAAVRYRLLKEARRRKYSALRWATESSSDMTFKGADAAIDCISSIPVDMPEGEYRETVAMALKALADDWRLRPEDDDGFALGTVHAIGGLLPEYGQLATLSKKPVE